VATVTLAESAKLSQDMLVQGIAETIVTVDQFFQVLPFDTVEGTALRITQEKTLGDVEELGVGDTISAKNPATYDERYFRLTTLLGDAEVNGLIQATRSDQQDQRAAQVASKAKNLGRSYRRQLISGSGLGNEFEGMLSLVDSSQVIEAGVNGAAFSFPLMDELMHQVTAKDGEVDFFLMHAKTLRAYRQELRQLGGAAIGETMTLPDGRTVMTYAGIPIFRNDYMPVDQVQGSNPNTTSIIAGCFDDGDQKTGVFGITARNASGIVVEDVGPAESRDESITRLKWYAGFALGTPLGLAVLKGVDVSNF
jgi:hypothetical protein